MKARYREVNIFSVSLLDILSGALGTFAFLMLVLIPYYRPLSAIKEEPQRIIHPKTFDEAIRQLADAREKGRRLYLAASRAQQENEQLQLLAQQRADENTHLRGQLNGT